MTHNVSQLRLGDQVLGLGPNELLLQDDQPGALGLLGLELGDLVGDLALALAAGLDALLRVADRLEHAAAVVQRVGVAVLLLAQLREQHADLVADVAYRVVARLLPPLGELRGDGYPLLGGRLVGPHEVVLRLDQAEEPAR